jgi:ArsR family transcriptional regulator
MEKTDAIQILTALGHDTRMDVFRLLVRAASFTPGAGGMAAGDIANELDLPAPTLSFHLKEMSRAGLVEGQRRGRSIHYTACTSTLQSVAQFLLEDCCQGQGCQPEKQA